MIRMTWIVSLVVIVELVVLAGLGLQEGRAAGAQALGGMASRYQGPGTAAADEPQPSLVSTGSTGFTAGWAFQHQATLKGYVGAPDDSAPEAPGEMVVFGAAGTPTSIWAGGTRALTVDTSGKIGIGTTSPDYKLHLAGHTTSDWPIIKLQDVDSGGHSYLLYAGANGTVSDFGIYDETDGAYRLYIQGRSGVVTVGDLIKVGSPPPNNGQLQVGNDNNGVAVYGSSRCCTGVEGFSPGGAGTIGVLGISDNGYGFSGRARITTRHTLLARSTSAGRWRSPGARSRSMTRLTRPTRPYRTRSLSRRT